MASRYYNSRPQYLTIDGKQAAVRDAFQYLDPGTSNPKAIFADAGKVTAIGGSTSTLLTDSNGELPAVFYDGLADVERTSANGVFRYRVTNVEGASTPNTFQDYSATVTYSIFDIVRASDGVLYESLVNSNLNNDPASEASPVQWKKIQFLGTWNANITYAIGDIVQGSNGFLFRSLTPSNLNNDPINDIINWGGATDADVPARVSAASALFNFNNISEFI